MTTEERAELPHFVLENFLVNTQGLDEEDAWIRVLQNYDEIKLDYYEHLATEDEKYDYPKWEPPSWIQIYDYYYCDNAYSSGVSP